VWRSLSHKIANDRNAFKITSGDSVPTVDSNSKEGNIYYNTNTGKLRIREESAWQVTSKQSITDRAEFKTLYGASTPSVNTIQNVFYNTDTKKLQYLKNDSWRTVAEEEVAGDTFNVGVDSYKFSLNNAVQPELNLYRGNEYVFNQSSADNSGQRLFVSNDLSGRVGSSSYNNSSSKTNPIILGHLNDSTMNLPRHIAIDSSRKVAFMVSHGNNNLLQIINIADPLNMTLISSLPGATTTMDKIWKLAYDSLRKLVFIGSHDTNNIGIVDVSNLNQPTLITTSITTHNRFNDFRHIVYDDTRQLIFITNYDGKVSCYDVSNYNSPVFKDEVQILITPGLGGSYGMAIDTIRNVFLYLLLVETRLLY